MRFTVCHTIRDGISSLSSRLIFIDQVKINRVFVKPITHRLNSVIIGFRFAASVFTLILTIHHGRFTDYDAEIRTQTIPFASVPSSMESEIFLDFFFALFIQRFRFFLPSNFFHFLISKQKVHLILRGFQ